MSFCVLDDFFRFSKKSGFWVFLVHPETTLPDGLETFGRREYREFWHTSRRFWLFAFWMIFFVFLKNRVLGYSWSTLLWHRCYYPHRSRDALSPVCGIFHLHFWKSYFLFFPIGTKRPLFLILFDYFLKLCLILILCLMGRTASSKYNKSFGIVLEQVIRLRINISSMCSNCSYSCWVMPYQTCELKHMHNKRISFLSMIFAWQFLYLYINLFLQSCNHF